MTAVWSYCCSCVDLSSNSRALCFSAPLRFLGAGIGITKSARRRLSAIRCVGCLSSPSSQWRAGYSYGEFGIGRSKKMLLIGEPGPLHAHDQVVASEMYAFASLLSSFFAAAYCAGPVP